MCDFDLLVIIIETATREAFIVLVSLALTNRDGGGNGKRMMNLALRVVR